MSGTSILLQNLVPWTLLAFVSHNAFLDLPYRNPKVISTHPLQLQTYRRHKNRRRPPRPLRDLLTPHGRPPRPRATQQQPTSLREEPASSNLMREAHAQHRQHDPHPPIRASCPSPSDPLKHARSHETVPEQSSLLAHAATASINGSDESGWPHGQRQRNRTLQHRRRTSGSRRHGFLVLRTAQTRPRDCQSWRLNGAIDRRRAEEQHAPCGSRAGRAE